MINNLKDEIELKDTLITKNKEDIAVLTKENQEFLQKNDLLSKDNAIIHRKLAEKVKETLKQKERIDDIEKKRN